MKFEEAVKAMKEGKKFIRANNSKCIFGIYDDDFDREIVLKDVEATNWKIVDEE